MEQPISIREYARRRGVSDTAVRKAIKAGKIDQGVTSVDGVPCILESIATQEWEQYAPTTRQPKTKAQPTPQPVKPTVAPPPAPSAPAHRATQAPEPPRAPQAGTIAAARLVKEQLNAKLLEITLREKLGSLVEKDKVYSALFSVGKEIRTNFQSIPDRFIDEIIAAPSRNEAHTILTNAIADALETVANLGKIDITK